MSTPRTDAACGWPWGHHGRIECADLKWSPDGPFVHSCVARELERENAALADENSRLHVELDAYHNGEQLRQMRAENAALRAELLEEARVNGMGGEREAKLLAEVAGLRKQLEQWEQSTQWFAEWAEKKQELERENAGLCGALEESQEYGRNHANAVMKLLSVISRIRFAVDSQPHRSQAMRLEDVGELCDEALGKKSSP